MMVPQLTLKATAMEASRINPKLFRTPQLSFPTDTHSGYHSTSLS